MSAPKYEQLVSVLQDAISRINGDTKDLEDVVKRAENHRSITLMAEVSGGVFQDVYIDGDVVSNVDLVVIDWDNINDGDSVSDTLYDCVWHKTEFVAFSHGLKNTMGAALFLVSLDDIDREEFLWLIEKDSPEALKMAADLQSHIEKVYEQHGACEELLAEIEWLNANYDLRLTAVPNNMRERLKAAGELYDHWGDVVDNDEEFTLPADRKIIKRLGYHNYRIRPCDVDRITMGQPFVVEGFLLAREDCSYGHVFDNLKDVADYLNRSESEHMGDSGSDWVVTDADGNKVSTRRLIDCGLQSAMGVAE